MDIAVLQWAMCAPVKWYWSEIGLIDPSLPISALDTSLVSADTARRDLDRAGREMDVAEARLTAADIEGKNEAERQARRLLALLDHGDYRDADQRAQDAAEGLRQAERQVRVLTERCRLLRAALALHAANE